MSLCNLILLISIVGFSTSSSIIRPQSLLIIRLLPQSTSLGDIADRWKKVHPEPKAPQIQIHLMKSYVSSDEKWAFSNEYKYSGEDYDDAAKATSMTDEKKVSRVETDDIDTGEKKKQNNASVQDVVMPDEFIPQIGFRNIITAPTYCPAGQRMDNRGRCRTIIM
ncbi:uncharacterized protein LOC105257545 [Camponotus floridanus]|uniref:uncharacterized protein LOC105257545 n=1 Tax=Camponotus floridanus TaxID=104421 RepID=UPI00059DECD4|nr:uncharacterized protein LOC105257545 [Camponotus floridanus]